VNGWRRSGFIAASAVIALCAWAAPTLAKSVGLTDGVTANLRPLDPYGDLVQLGNFPGGAAVTPDGRFLLNVDAGWSQDDVKIVDVQTPQGDPDDQAAGDKRRGRPRRRPPPGLRLG